MSKIKDEQIIAGARVNSLDEDLLRHFIEEDSAVRSYVMAVTRGHQDTDDVIQDVWRVACLKIAEYDSGRPFRSWVMGITRLQLLKWRQALARSREILAPDLIELLADTAETQREELDLRSQYLRDCLARLPVYGRGILQMKYFRDMKIEAIAARLKKNTAAIEMTLVRLRRSLRVCIEGKLRDDGKVTA